jgi:hypothetical protein
MKDLKKLFTLVLLLFVLQACDKDDSNLIVNFNEEEIPGGVGEKGSTNSGRINTICGISGPSVGSPKDILTYTYTTDLSNPNYSWNVTGDITIISGQGTATVTILLGDNFNGGTIQGYGSALDVCSETKTIILPPPCTPKTCPTSIIYGNEGGGGLCTTGLARLNINDACVSHVNWTWALGIHSGTINNAGITTPIYYPSGNWTNYYIVVRAEVVFNDGSSCSQVSNSFLLNCGTGPGFPVGM